MAERRPPPSAAQRVAAAERLWPGALELAALVPQAARIERRLLRALRLQLLPHRRAGDEAELWTSDLVELRALDGLVLRADVQELLRGRGRAVLQQPVLRGAAAERAARLRRAHQLLLEHHAGAPPLVRLEEEIAWLAMEGAAPGDAIQRKLEVALAALIRDGRVGVARWATRALPRLPEAARATRAAWLLSVASSDRLPTGRGTPLAPPAGLRLVDLQALSSHLGHTPLGVRRIGDRLELGAVGPGGAALMVPASEPRLIRVDQVDLALPAGTRHEHAVGWETVTLQAADGRRWELPVLSDDEQRWLDQVRVPLHRSNGEPAIGCLVAPDRWVSVELATPGALHGTLMQHQAPPPPRASQPQAPQSQALQSQAAAVPPAQPLPLATGLPDDARVASLAVGRDGTLLPVVGRCFDGSEMGLTVLARTRAPPEGCLGAPVIFDGKLAGVVTGVGVETPAAAGDDPALELRLFLATGADPLLGRPPASQIAAVTVDLLPARNGQAVLIGWGTAPQRRYLLFGGGPRATAQEVIARVQHALGPQGRLEVAVASHADANHVEGVVELLAAGVPVDDVWFNGASQLGLDGAPTRAVERLQQRVLSMARVGNAAFEGRPIVAPSEGPLPRVALPGGATVTLLGPGPQQLEALARAWERSSARRADAPLRSTPQALPEDAAAESTDEPAAAAASPDPDLRRQSFGGDRGTNNGASLVLLFEYEGHSVLLPGDAHAAPLVAALRRLAAERGRSGMFVDVAVLPHAGSRGNVSPELFEVLEAGTWAICTDGSVFGHPDPEAIELLARHAPGSTLAFNYRSQTTERYASPAFLREHRLRVEMPASHDAGLSLQLGPVSESSAAASSGLHTTGTPRPATRS